MGKLKLGFVALELVGVIGLVVALAATIFAFNNFTSLTSKAGEDSKLSVFNILNSSDVVNEDGSDFQDSGSRWLGTGQDIDKSYMGLAFKGQTIPKGAKIISAKLEFTQPKEEWIGVSFAVFAEKVQAPEAFSSSNRPSQRSLTTGSAAYSDDVKWLAGEEYSYSVVVPIQELVNEFSVDSINLIIKGTGTQWGRKFVYDGGVKPTLEVRYSATTAAMASATTATATATASATATAATTPSPMVHPTQTPTATSRSTPTSTAQPTSTPVVTSTPGNTSGGIFGLVTADVLGSCSAAVHDKYVVVGPDGKTYRTWHPAKDPSGCTFGHEHGDDPSTSNIFAGPVPFGYIAGQLGMDEPHVGFKCFVHNKGQKNDEGSAMLHDTYFCFHMGTGGPARFSARFHSLDFHMTSAASYKLNVQGMADIGNVGTICDNPRQRRTVQGFGCLLDSSYEIWENVLNIRNRGNVVASAIVSTAVFDPITSMDPADLTRTVYTWSEEAQQKIFKFRDPRDDYRGCDREAYSGPVYWYNRGGSQVYYTDPYGNVVDGGVLRQEISAINTDQNTGFVNRFGGLRMTYKDSEEMTQFKYRKSACVPGLGIKN